MVLIQVNYVSLKAGFAPEPLWQFGKKSAVAWKPDVGLAIMETYRVTASINDSEVLLQPWMAGNAANRSLRGLW